MTENNKIPDFLTFPKTFENYKWYKPILVFIITAAIFAILNIVVFKIFHQYFGTDVMAGIIRGGYEVLDTEIGLIFSDLLIILFIPSLYIASRIVRDRPFSSYGSSRGGWNFKLYLKALIIPLILFIVFMSIDTIIQGPDGTYHFSIAFLIITLITVPLQCIAEEYAFRGLVLQTFGSWLNIPVLAIVIQSIIFAVSHSYNSLGIIEVLVFALIMGYFTWKTNGIEVSSALHSANNLSLSLFVMFGIQASTSSPTLYDVSTSIVFEIILAAIMYYVINKTEFLSEIEENTQDT